MSIFMTLIIALKALNRNKMRTILTMLGMIIGVGAVITMVALGRGAQSTIEGTDVDFPSIRSWPVKYGTFFTQQDVNSAAKVAVLGTVVADTLFGPDVDPTGQIMRIRNQPFKIIGVMASKGQGSFGQDQDDVIFTPYTTVQKKLQGIQHINNITVAGGAAGPGAGGDGHWRGASDPPQDSAGRAGRLHGPHPGGDRQRS